MADSKGSNQGFKKLPNIHVRDKGASRPNRPNRQHVKPSKVAPPPTPEEVAAILKARAEAAAKAKIEADRLLVLGRALPRMSFRQLRGTICTYIRKEPNLLSVAEAICARTILEGTQTKENPFAKLSSYLR